jgi:branched-chain amino acid transport system permease protein
MALGSYAMGIAVVRWEISFWLALGIGIVVAMLAALLVGLPSLRLRADYFAISTLAFSEIVRYIADNWDGLTGGNLGLFGYTDAWNDLSARVDGWLGHLGIAPRFLLPLLVVNLVVFLVLAAFVALLVRSPWGRVLNAIREDEDAARALGKNTFAYKRQSLSIAAALAAIAGYMLAINISILSPANFDPVLTAYGYVIVILGGLGSYFGVVLGSFFLIFLLEATRYLELPLSDARVASLRFVIVGLVLMALVVFRPQGLLGKREELMLRAHR